MKVVVDTNIFFSALLRKENKFRNVLLLNSEDSFYTCHLLMIEIFKYKEKIIKFSKLSEVEMLEIFYDLMKKVELYNETYITKESLLQAYNLCQDIDDKDIPFVALTLELNGVLWTRDKELKEGLSKKGFSYFYEIN
jgi:predicted nucleic acid-binding protein